MMAGQYKFSSVEIQQLTVAAIVLAFSFSLVLFRQDIFAGGFARILHNYDINYFITSLVAVGAAFILHELSHKFVAQRKGMWSEFRFWPVGLLIATVSSFFGFVFAAPGATMISPVHRRRFGYSVTILKEKDMGHIGIAGIITNFVLCGIFSIAAILTGMQIFKIAGIINIWLAVFNLIPFGPLDGVKVLKWSPWIWLATLGIGALLFFMTLMI